MAKNENNVRICQVGKYFSSSIILSYWVTYAWYSWETEKKAGPYFEFLNKKQIISE